MAEPLVLLGRCGTALLPMAGADLEPGNDQAFHGLLNRPKLLQGLAIPPEDLPHRNIGLKEVFVWNDDNKEAVFQQPPVYLYEV